MSTGPTSWMWQDEATASVKGVILEDGVLHWYDEPGCACDDSDLEQSVADFLARGPRGYNPPADVLEQMHTALKQWADG